MKKERKLRWQLCNVVSSSDTERELAQFRAKGAAFTPVKTQTVAADQKLPPKAVGKTLQSVWTKKLNIALLPPGKVFMGVVELPAVDQDELYGMLEFQLEKLSPLPVSHIVWTYHILPSKVEGMTRVVLIIAARNEVEALLGRLEKGGFLADRLEFPLLDELLTLLDKDDGLWLHPWKVGEEYHALAVWISGGELKNVTMFYLPLEGWEDMLTHQLSQTVWSGELDGWLDGAPRCSLLADEELANVFAPVLKEFSGAEVDVHPAPSKAQLTQLTANRAAGPKAASSLLPPDIAKRYHQTFVDGLWMRSLGVVVVIYVFGVLLYFLGIEWAKFEKAEAEDYLESIAPQYTNTVHAAQRVKILQNQMNLKYAALDSFRAVAENLPEGIQLNNFNFQQGSKIIVYGTAPMSAPGKISEFVDKLRVAESEGQPLFNNVLAPSISTKPGTQLNNWNFSGELANPEQK